MVQWNIDDVRNEFSNLRSVLVRDIDYSPPQGWRGFWIFFISAVQAIYSVFSCGGDFRPVHVTLLEVTFDDISRYT